MKLTKIAEHYGVKEQKLKDVVSGCAFHVSDHIISKHIKAMRDEIDKEILN